MDKKGGKFLDVGIKLIASEAFSIRKLQAQTGNPSTKTIYRQLHKWQRELGQEGKPNARKVIVDFAIHNTWRELLNILKDEEKKFPLDPLALLESFTTRMVHFFCQDLALTRVVTRGNPSWASKSQRSFTPSQRDCWGLLRRIVRLAQKQGSITKSIDPDLLLRLIHGALHQALYGLTLREVMDEHYTAEDVINGMVWLLNRIREGVPEELKQVATT